MRSDHVACRLLAFGLVWRRLSRFCSRSSYNLSAYLAINFKGHSGCSNILLKEVLIPQFVSTVINPAKRENKKAAPRPIPIAEQLRPSTLQDTSPTVTMVARTSRLASRLFIREERHLARNQWRHLESDIHQKELLI